MTEVIERHTFAVIVDNEPGVLARVIGLFAGRGYNIDNLTVAEVRRTDATSRITLVTTGTRMIIEQIKAQLRRLVPVQAVHDLTDEGPFVAKELALIKVANKDTARHEALRIADIFNATVADTTLASFVFVMTGSPGKVDSFVELMDALGETEVVRSGVVAIARGEAVLGTGFADAAGEGGEQGG